MRAKPIIYVGLNFMDAFIAKARKNHLELSTTESQNVTHSKYLLENSGIELELDTDKLRKIISLQHEDIENFQLLASELKIDIYLLKYIRKLYQSNTDMKSVKDKLLSLKPLQATTEPLPNSIMIKCDSTFASRFENHFGILCYDGSFNNDTNCFLINTISLNKDTVVLEELKKTNLKPIYSVIFSDPYIFSNDAEGKDLLAILKIIFNNRLDKINTCLIEYSDDKGKFNETNFTTIFKSIFTDTDLKLEKRTKSFFHDRNIFTNNYTISADAGFKLKYDKVTKWIIYPTLTNYHFQKEQTKKYISEFSNLLNY